MELPFERASSSIRYLVAKQRGIMSQMKIGSKKSWNKWRRLWEHVSQLRLWSLYD